MKVRDRLQLHVRERGEAGCDRSKGMRAELCYPAPCPLLGVD
jgi:hypothetical protein